MVGLVLMRKKRTYWLLQVAHCGAGTSVFLCYSYADLPKPRPAGVRRQGRASGQPSSYVTDPLHASHQRLGRSGIPAYGLRALIHGLHIPQALSTRR